MKGGFLGTVAPPYYNLILLFEIARGVGLLIGVLLLRLRRFPLHAWCQSSTVLVNRAVIVVTMIPSFRVQVIPQIPLKFDTAYYGLATAHAELGTITEVAGMYILLAAGASVLPKKFRLTKYRIWMRTILALWWVLLMLGSETYAHRHVRHLFPK